MRNTIQSNSLNVRHLITAQCNNMYTVTVEAISIVLKGYKNSSLAGNPDS